MLTLKSKGKSIAVVNSSGWERSSDILNFRKVVRRFSLAELLMVIAIFAVLLSLMAPALKDMNYKGSNLSCSFNQKSIVMGVSNYAADYNDYYPYSPEVEENRTISPTILKYTEIGLDYISALGPYFEFKLKNAMTCPLAPGLYQSGGTVRYSRTSYDMDEPSNDLLINSYSHFYGRDVSGEDDALWGAGSPFFIVTKGKVKVGDTQTFNCPGTEYDDLGFDIMTSDVMWRQKEKRIWIHETPEAYTEVDSYYGEFETNFPQALDLNFSLEDGSVHYLDGVVLGEDERVTLSRWNEDRGWALPLYQDEL